MYTERASKSNSAGNTLPRLRAQEILVFMTVTSACGTARMMFYSKTGPFDAGARGRVKSCRRIRPRCPSQKTTCESHRPPSRSSKRNRPRPETSRQPGPVLRSPGSPDMHKGNRACKADGLGKRGVRRPPAGGGGAAPRRCLGAMTGGRLV